MLLMLMSTQFSLADTCACAYAYVYVNALVKTRLKCLLCFARMQLNHRPWVKMAVKKLP